MITITLRYRYRVRFLIDLLQEPMMMKREWGLCEGGDEHLDFERQGLYVHLTHRNMKHSLKAKINDLKGELVSFRANFYNLKAKTQL